MDSVMFPAKFKELLGEDGQKRSKFNVGAKADRTRDGIVFDSVAEATYYDELLLRRDREGGDVSNFLRQVPIDIRVGVDKKGRIRMQRHRVDFLIFYKDGWAEFVDVKGFDTPEGKRMRDDVEKLYGWNITLRTGGKRK